jgi:hypothetical protein
MVDGSCNPLAGSRAIRCPAVDGWMLEALLKKRAIVVQSSVVVARELLEAAGGYDEALTICGDYELWLRLASRSEVDFIDEPLVHVRRHDQHYCDDVTAVKDLRRMIEKVRRSPAAAHLKSVVRWRRAEVSALLARSYAVSGNRTRVLSTLFASVHYSWRYRDWWRGALAATVRAFAPAPVLTAVRRYRSAHAGR